MLPHYTNLPRNSVLCILAPTASGKTALAYRLCDAGFDIISVDSALIYTDMDIGTAKPSKAQLQRYPHALVDIMPPTQNYSVANFVIDTRILIEQSHQNGRIPALVGGSMMYFMALLDGISPVPQTDLGVRQKVQALHQKHGNAFWYDYLQTHDPTTAKRLNLSDTQRIIRAAEVHVQTSMPISFYQNLPKTALANQDAFCFFSACVLPNRTWLHTRIARRLELMWQDGFFDEVIDLVHKYAVLPDMPSMRTVGYRQVLEYLILHAPDVLQNTALGAYLASEDGDRYKQSLKFDSKDAYSQMKDRALCATRQLAKRQYTWLNKITALSPIRGYIGSYASMDEVENQLFTYN